MSACRHPGYDPLLHAGRLWCERCQTWGLPTDAAWLDSKLVLACYVGCEHTNRTMVVDSTTITPDVRCAATTKSGRRCRLSATDAGGLCSVHAPVEHREAR